MSFAAAPQVSSVPPAPVRRLKWLAFTALGLQVLTLVLSLMLSGSGVEQTFSFPDLIPPIACVALAFGVERGSNGARGALIAVPFVGVVGVVHGMSVLSDSTRLLPKVLAPLELDILGPLVLICADFAMYIAILWHANNLQTALWCRPRPAGGDTVLGQPSPPYPPQYGQSQYGQSQYGQSQYGQPLYGQPPYGQPPYPQQSPAQPGAFPPQPSPPQPSGQPDPHPQA